MEIDRNRRRLQADSERSLTANEVDRSERVFSTIHCSYLDALQNAYTIDYARNDGIISRSLIRLVYDNELLVKTGDMFDPFVLLKDT